VALAPVELEDYHMGSGAKHEEEEENGGDGNVNFDCRDAPEAGGLRCVRRVL